MNVSTPEPDVLFVSLSPEPQLAQELAQLREHLAQEAGTHLVLDLGCVEIITSPCLSSLLALQQVVAQHGRRLILCNAHLATKCIFRVAGLDSVVEFQNNKLDALKALHRQAVPHS
jgi:anti-anti-sigma factor